MKKFLRSPLAVTLMVLLAAGIVYNNVIAPLQSKPVFTAAVDDPALYTITPVETAQYNTLVWQLRDADRNPFANQPLHHAQQQKIIITSHKVTKTVKKQLRLSAILSGGQNPLALISGQLVGLHDTIDGFTVLSIKKNRVQLQRKNIHETLFLPQDSRR
ncbi:MAG TPA: hypothetical protein EYP39_06100 [Ghiorsea sp.]|nr:hypothetical protein [Ghiorsea sp.]HIP06332.1 hypothetical protein [Mariprofundaceae bacterium]